MIRIRALLAATLVAAATAGSACGGPAAAANPAASAPDKPITLTLQTYLPVLGDTANNTVKDLLATFEQAHPNIKVTISVESPPGLAPLQRDIVAGNPPDISQQPFDGLKFMIKSLGAQNLDQIAGPGAVKAALAGDHPFVPPATQLAVVNGHTYGIPWTLSTPVLFYNPTLFTAAGLDPAKPPSTWQEVEDAARAIKAKTGADGIVNGCVGSTTFNGSVGADWCLQAIIKSNGGTVISNDDKTLTWTNPNTVSTARAMQRLGSSGAAVNLTSAQTIQAFGAGRLGMILNSSAIQGTLLNAAGGRFQVVNTAMPGFPGHTATPTNSGSALFVITKDPARQKASWELIKWLTGNESQTAIAKNIGYPPLRITLADDPKYLKSWAQAQTLLPANLNQLQHLVSWQAYPGPHYAQIETLLVNSFTEIIFQQADPQQSLAQAQSQAQGLIQ